jgi:predicted O-linked N-acetylglucosamine transferase (SPINDLY family)
MSYTKQDISQLQIEVELQALPLSCWNLGLAYLLSGNEEEAQATWFLPFLEMEIAQDEIDLTTSLVCFLSEYAADDLISLEQQMLIRQHIQSIMPDNTLNVLNLIVVSAKLDVLDGQLLLSWQALNLKYSSLVSVELLSEVFDALLPQCNEISLCVINLYLRWLSVDRYKIISKLVSFAFQIFCRENQGEYAIRIVEICLQFYPHDLNALQVICSLYTAMNRHDEAIAIAEKCLTLNNDKFQDLFVSYLAQKAHFGSGNWNDAESRYLKHRKLMEIVLSIPPDQLPSVCNSSLISSSFFGFYVKDSPRTDRIIQNKLAHFYQKTLSLPSTNVSVPNPQEKSKEVILRIGYLASTLREHSVGWLARWLFHYRDRSKFQVFCYCINQSPDDEFNHKWFRDKSDVSYYFGIDSKQMVDRIKADEINILVDLDSLTLDLSCLIMAQKPAPVQITWLGFDATGLPAIDYFIADPYVLPGDAQDYYSERIWRLPQTYLAVDGFEVGIPTINRKNLSIPDDAIIYFSSQNGCKRNPDNIRAQMKIIAAVPNSYFLIKGKSDKLTIEKFFNEIARSEGVDSNRLRFLDIVEDELTHRANLAIADIVLDTFPYNGATTTLETLWMGIPMVTQVGEQFAARNSYTFMLNAGIDEGIAWSQSEYIEWGIKLGLDQDLRLKIREKLRVGRSISPVWDARQFTLDMESAYYEMWKIYEQQQ